VSDRMNDGTPGEFPPDTEHAHRRPALSLTLEGAVALEGELRIRVACGPSGGMADLRLLARTDTEEPTAVRFLTGQRADLGTEAPEARSEADADAEMLRWVRSLSHHAPLACAVVHPCDEGSLRGAIDAYEAGLIVPVIVAPRARIESAARAAGLSLAGTEIIDTPHSHASAAEAVALAAAGRVAMLMKGSLHTDELMEAVLAEPRLKTGRRMSHVFRFEVPAYDRPLLLTDAAINIAPTLLEKADILRNAIDLAHALGLARPRVALLSAVETVTPRIPSTIDAAALCKMADRGQIAGAILDGPLAFDNAISAEAARVKGIESSVAGQAEILFVPDIEAGNVLAKQLEYWAGAASCGVVLGARVPIALTSRADPAISRVASAALAAVAARAQVKAVPGR
jgi:phosphate acetyltransferase